MVINSKCFCGDRLTSVCLDISDVRVCAAHLVPAWSAHWRMNPFCCLSSAQICGSIRNCSSCVQGGWVWPRRVNSPSLALSWENSSAATPVDTSGHQQHGDTAGHRMDDGRWLDAGQWSSDINILQSYLIHCDWINMNMIHKLFET